MYDKQQRKFYVQLTGYTLRGYIKVFYIVGKICLFSCIMKSTGKLQIGKAKVFYWLSQSKNDKNDF